MRREKTETGRLPAGDAAAAERETFAAQATASDPRASAWVAANAGAGKTHVLKMRVLRLLLSGTPPERILCLTYTKAAAAEMSARVFGDLATWATATDDVLARTLQDLTGEREAPADLMVRARRLFARAIETPGGLKVQTIHAFCERLLQRFPLEAGVPPGFTILDDDMAGDLFDRALTEVLDRAVGEPGSHLAEALGRLVVHAHGDALEQLIRAAIGRRTWLQMLADLGQRADDPGVLRRRLYAQSLDLDPAATVESLAADAAAVIDDATLARAASVLTESGAKTAVALAERLTAARTAASLAERRRHLEAAFLTQDRSVRAHGYIVKAVRTAEPGLCQLLDAARDQIHDLSIASDAVAVVEQTVALATVALAVMERYGAAKMLRAALDFDDLIGKSAALLSVSKAADWVLFKLDGGLDHVLVDEAQDTSPEQWRVISALVEEFFSGDGRRRETAEGRAVTRTVFAVGDEKQSIYSFQGAAPEMFQAVGDRFATSARGIGARWHEIPLTLSFRTVEPVLAAVDAALADGGRTPGVVRPGARLLHRARRMGEAGLVEVWPVEKPAEVEAGEAFAPGHAPPEPSPAERLARRIADLIRHWLETGERLPSVDRSIQPGDIMILVARRRPFADVMVPALKARGIPVAGADRMQLADQLAVQDLLALAAALALPEDDLALAAALKSPLFDLTDEDLIALAPGRPGSLYSAVMKAGETNLRLATVAGRLRRWRALADRKPPFEFFAQVLDEDGMRERLIARLGPEAIDPIDEFVAAALADDDRAPASLQGFLERMRAANRIVKRDMEPGRDEVRVLTVHGAKGLEAPIVFLPDTCAAGTGGRAQLVPLAAETMRRVWPVDVPPAYVWPVKGSGRVTAISEARESVSGAELEERNRLLYVAMTRARDRLYVAGFVGRRARPDTCWYDSVVAGAAPLLADAVDHAGLPVQRVESQQTIAPPAAISTARAKSDRVPALPAWARERAPREARPTIPLVPSRLAPLEIDSAGEPQWGVADSAPGAAPVQRLSEPSSPPPAVLAGDGRFLRGRLTHSLLELLPALPQHERRAAAERLLETRGAALPERMRRSILNETLAVLADPAFRDVFGPDSEAEVAIAAEVLDPLGRRPPLRIVGQIDRLLVTATRILVIDFKSNRPPPTAAADVPLAYQLQLAAYRFGLAQVFPGTPIEVALLWTDGPRLMPIPSEVLDKLTSQLWEPQNEVRV